MGRFVRWVIFCGISIALSACATSGLERAQRDANGFDARLVWPPPPQTARVHFERSISGPSDIGTRKSWLKRAIDSLLGKEEAAERLLRPYGVFADSGKIYVTDTGSRVLHIFDTKEKKYFAIRKVGRTELVSPIGVIADSAGRIYLSDSLLKKIFVLDGGGRYLMEIGTGDMLARPSGICADGERLYVVDTHGHKIVVFSEKDGSLLYTFGGNGSGEGELNYPTNIFIDRQGLLYVTDSMNFRVQIFDRTGRFISMFGKHGDGSGDFSKPRGIAVDSDGHIYVADALFDAVQIFDREGRLLLAFGSTGKGDGEMILPAGVFIDADDRIYVADSYNMRVQIFRYLKGEVECPGVQGVK